MHSAREFQHVHEPICYAHTPIRVVMLHSLANLPVQTPHSLSDTGTFSVTFQALGGLQMPSDSIFFDHDSLRVLSSTTQIESNKFLLLVETQISSPSSLFDVSIGLPQWYQCRKRMVR